MKETKFGKMKPPSKSVEIEDEVLTYNKIRKNQMQLKLIEAESFTDKPCWA